MRIYRTGGAHGNSKALRRVEVLARAVTNDPANGRVDWTLERRGRVLDTWCRRHGDGNLPHCDFFRDWRKLFVWTAPVKSLKGVWRLESREGEVPLSYLRRLEAEVVAAGVESLGSFKINN